MQGISFDSFVLVQGNCELYSSGIFSHFLCNYIANGKVMNKDFTGS